MRLEKNNRFWIKRFEGGYVLGDFVSGLSTHAFDKAENKYTKAELRKVREFIKGVICWKPNTAYQAAIACFNSWLEDKEGVGDDENHQILEHVKSFFELHAHSRFFDLDGFKDQKISNMAGYKSVYQDAVTFLYLCQFFFSEIC